MKGATQASPTLIRHHQVTRRLYTMEQDFHRPPEQPEPVPMDILDIPAYQRRRIKRMDHDDAERMRQWTEKSLAALNGYAADREAA